MMHRLLTVILCCCLSQAMAGEPPSEADLKKLKSDIKAAQQRIRQSEDKKDQLSQVLRNTETKLSVTARRIHGLADNIKELQQQLDKLQKQQQKLEQEKQTQEDTLDEQIATSYRMGREKAIKMLLNQEDPQKLSRAMTYADYFSRARVESLMRYQKILQELSDNRAAITSKSESLVASKEKLVAERQQLQGIYRQRNQALATLNSSIKSEQQKLQNMQQEQKQLEMLLRSVNQAVANIRLPGDSIPFSKTRGRLLWPTDGQRDNRYGKRRPPGNLRWEGIAFYAPAGTDVKAVHHGRVVFADWFRGKGLLLIIDHGDGYMTLYAHNQALLRETGDWVSAGETIATVGNSGGLDKPELYFEIRYQGEPLNPAQWLRRG